MLPILLGALAFPAALAFDWVSWQRITRLKPLLGLTSMATLGTALIWVLAAPGRFTWPAWVQWGGWLVLAISSALLVYSLFIEIPLAATYARPGVGDTLVRTGTYALVRHPGVLWFGLFMLGLLLASRVRLVLAAGVIWFLLDVALVALEEAFLFRKMFPGYAAYQRETPMLVPTPQSVARCLRTWPWRGCGARPPESD